jgi:hypothetical protein
MKRVINLAADGRDRHAELCVTLCSPVRRLSATGRGRLVSTSTDALAKIPTYHQMHEHGAKRGGSYERGYDLPTAADNDRPRR